MSESTLQMDHTNESEGHDDVARLLASDSIRKFTVPEKTTKTLKILVGIGVAAIVLGLAFERESLWASLLVNSYYLLGLGLGAIFLICTLYLTGAAWGIVVRRISEAMTGIIPVAAAGILIAITLGKSIYPAFTGEEHLVGFKGLWLGYSFFFVRAFVYIGIWLFFTRAILSNSRKQDRDGSVGHTHANVKWSAIFIVLFALTVWLSSFDWIMSLEPHWFSTIFGVYCFSGIFASSIAATIVIVVWLHGQGVLRGIITEDHLQDLGKLLLAFTTFWAYIWISQYLLIWYGDLPEETGYFIVRTGSVWGPLFLFNVVLNWIVPFFALLPRGTKRNGNILVKIAVVVLIGHWLDLYLMVYGATSPGAIPFGLVEVGLALGAVGVFGLVVLKKLSSWPLVPLKDPYLQESLHHHQ
ncbi:MAG: hypothetical protein L3K26_09675 [Candidatus Hydrogenedentes bacterium]|nr:hypothetical protein [Candidatus Hydrogenedentota bacterium]